MGGTTSVDGVVNGNGWTEWRKHVFLEFERFNKNLEVINERQITMCMEIAKLKAYSALWGAIGGSIITLVGTLIVSRI
jgi:hypothetical protein